VREFTAQQLRDLVENLIGPSLEQHRGSREMSDNNYRAPFQKSATEKEITDFILSNPLIHIETAQQRQ